VALTVAFIGAGSVGFTRKLIRDLLSVPEFADTHFALHDIDEGNLDRVAQIVQRDIDGNDLPTTISKHLDRKPALEGADYVINTTRIGGLEAFETDIEVPLKYGVDQCVGDTLAPGGIMYGQRNIPQILDFQRDMKAVAADDCLFLNYANPMAMNTWAALDARDRGEGVETIGLCHGVEGGWRQIAAVLAKLHGDEDELQVPDEPRTWLDRNPHRKLVDVICAGINHQTWYVKVIYKGRPVEADELLEAFENHDKIHAKEKVRVDVLRRFGCYSTESNGHLSEYVPWYRKRPNEINDWIDLSAWIHGETGGYLRVCREGRGWFKTDFPKWLEEAGGPIDPTRRSSEHGSWIIEAIETGRPYRGHFNVRNHGVISNLPDDCVVEAPGWVDRFGINMVNGLELSQACAATCRASIDVQRMSKDAAVAGDVTMLKRAMLHDPLTAAVLNPEEVWQLTDEMLVAGAEWLPQYWRRGEIDLARHRLAEHERDGTRVRTTDWAGAARVEERSVEQLRAEKEASVLDADKAAAARSKVEAPPARG